jgi:hypothetical protein
MASRTFTSNNGNDRIVISTILNHWIAFDEAGFEFSTERKRNRRVEWWNPFTWGGVEWKRSNDALQPSIDDFVFIQAPRVRRNPRDLAVSESRSTGYFKSSCVKVGINVGSSGVGPGDGSADLRNDARSVEDVIIEFTYNGVSRTLQHSFA